MAGYPPFSWRSASMWRAVVCELFGTFMLMYVGVASVFPPQEIPHIDNLVSPALCFFGLIATLVHLLGPTSGCHINPAVTLSVALIDGIHPITAVLYFIAQMIGRFLLKNHSFFSLSYLSISCFRRYCRCGVSVPGDSRGMVRKIPSGHD